MWDLRWEALHLTLLLVGLHAFLYAFLFVVTLKPAFTLFHLFLATQTVAFVLRPLLGAAEGGFSLYGGPWDFYNQGLLINFIANGIVGVGYLMVYAWHRPREGMGLQVFKGALSVITWISFSLGAIVLTLIHLLSGGAWLPTARDQTVTTVVPFGKFLFPLAVIPLSFSLLSGMVLFYFNLRYTGKPLRFNFLRLTIFSTVTLASVLLLSLLYQRGFILSSFLAFFFLLGRFNRWGYAKLALAALVSLLVLTQIRPLAVQISTFFSSSESTGAVSEQNGQNRVPFLQRQFLYSPNFDTIDVWPVVFSYVEENGYLGGATFLAIPMRFFPLTVRKDTGSLTAVDVLNEYYWGETYWEKSFGFNVTFIQEAYLNFGTLGIFLPLLSGMVGAWLDRKIWSMSLLTPARLCTLLAVFFVGIPVGELGGILQWSLAFLMYGFALSVIMSFLRLAKRYHADSLPHHPR